MKKAHRLSDTRKSVSSFLIVFSLLLITGCAATPPAETPSAAPAEVSTYAEVLERWTRSEKVYEWFELKFSISATYKSLPFREAYVDEYALKYRMGEELKRVLLSSELDSFESYNEVFLSAYTLDESWNDFDKKDSVWRLYLEDGLGRSVRPVEIEKAGTRDALVKAFFPYLNRWSTGYTIRFPKYDERGEPLGEGAGNLRLVITGVIGEAELEWNLEGEGP